MATITERSTKAEIIDAAVELTDSQADRIARLEQQQQILLVALATLAAWILL